MARAPLQVLVLPYRFTASGRIEFAIFRRANYPDECWQGIAGGAEQGETVEQAVRREMLEEAAIPANAPLIPLDSVASIRPRSFAIGISGDQRRMSCPSRHLVSS